MYESYWGLNARPFDRRGDAAFYYPAENQHAALVKLRYALEHGGAAALTGPAGAGKTLLIDLLARQFEGQGCIFIRLAFPLLSPAELLRYLADELVGDELPSDLRQAVDLSLRRIEGALRKLSAEEKRLVIVIDEAHTIVDPQTWEALRLLLNLENAGSRPPVLLLVGQTVLFQMLSRMPGLEDQLTARCLLPAFAAEETAAYIAHRLQAAGAQREIFDSSAIEAAHPLAQGIPRRINRLCDLGLLVGYAEERPTITAEQIEAVAEELISLNCAQMNTSGQSPL
jgi:general secretion pathway protein A